MVLVLFVNFYLLKFAVRGKLIKLAVLNLYLFRELRRCFRRKAQTVSFCLLSLFSVFIFLYFLYDVKILKIKCAVLSYSLFGFSSSFHSYFYLLKLVNYSYVSYPTQPALFKRNTYMCLLGLVFQSYLLSLNLLCLKPC